MSSNPAPTKTCLVCGIDVSNKPRVKDSQSRYTCKDCLDRAAKAKQAQQQAKDPKAAAGSQGNDKAEQATADNAFLLDLGKPAIKEGHHACPNCGKPISDEAKICINCGMNQQTGQRLHVNVLKPKDDKKSKPPRR